VNPAAAFTVGGITVCRNEGQEKKEGVQPVKAKTPKVNRSTLLGGCWADGTRY